jgi:hypothetical protein
MGLEDLLWFYILKEAKARGAGNQLGPVGGRIVAEVPLELLGADDPPDLAAPEAFGGDRHLFLAKRRRVRGGRRGEHVTVTGPEAPSDTGGALG